MPRPRFVPSASSSPVRITDVPTEALERISTRIAPLDRVLGGGLVPDSIVILGGEPGSGKSTLVAQLLAGCGLKTLYLTAEETVAQATLRASHVGALSTDVWIATVSTTDEIITYGRSLGASIVVVDSIQTVISEHAAGAPGSITQAKAVTSELASWAKSEHVIVILIGHVTKDGSIAGPNTVRHLVDVCLLLEQVDDVPERRTLRADGKNRFGSTAEVGVFTMSERGLLWQHDATQD